MGKIFQVMAFFNGKGLISSSFSSDQGPSPSLKTKAATGKPLILKGKSWENHHVYGTIMKKNILFSGKTIGNHHVEGENKHASSISVEVSKPELGLTLGFLTGRQQSCISR